MGFTSSYDVRKSNDAGPLAAHFDFSSRAVQFHKLTQGSSWIMVARNTTIKFLGNLNDTNIESLLTRYYHKSRDAHGTVIFDLQDITWCDPFSLSLLTLWIKELVSLKVKIHVLSPLEPKLQHFFQGFHFVKTLIAAEISHNFLDSGALPVDMQIVSPTLPLTFYDAPGLGKLLNDLQSTDRINIVLREISDADIVKSGAIRDVVIAELGNNFFNHAEGRFAHLLMITSGVVPDDKLSARTRAQTNNVYPSEKSFFQTLRGQPFLTLVFSDMGPGIPETIRQAYIDDLVVGQKVENPTDKDLLKYAFLYHSTGRTLKQRTGRLSEIIKDIKNMPPPPTGLYHLRKIVREYQGMLVVRSRKARLVEDFLSSLAPPINFEDVSDFGGTQYKLYIPFNTPRSRSGYTANLPRSSNQRGLLCVQCATALPQERPADVASALESLFAAIESARLDAIKEKKPLIIDAKGIDILPSNALFYLQLELMRRQELPQQCSVIVNGPSSLPEIHENTLTNDPNALPIIVFDQNWIPHAVGLRSEEESLFRTILTNSKSTDAKVRNFAKKHPEWFQRCSTEVKSVDAFEFRFTESALKVALRSAYAHRLSKALTDPSEEFFSPDAKVLLPSKSYCHGYFDISKFASSHRFKYMLQDWIAYGIEKFAPKYIVTIGATAAGLVLKRDFEVAGTPKILHLPTPIAPNKLFSVSNAIPSNSSVVIITDVIGTSNTLRNAFKQLRRGKIVVTLAIVDATHQDEFNLFFEGETFAIEAIFKHKLTYHPDLPAGWDYDEISQVDPETHALISNPRHSAKNTEQRKGPASCLWIGPEVLLSQGEPSTFALRSNPFLDDAVIPSLAILEGHYVSADSHMIHLFNIPALLTAFGEKITDKIHGDSIVYLNNMTSPAKIAQIAYPEYNIGLAKLARLLSARFVGSSPMPISRHILKRRLTSAVQFGHAVIFLDDAMYSGNTIFEMLDLAEVSGVEHALVYTILTRGPVSLTNRVRKIRQYGRTRVTFREIASVEIPVFKRLDCPACALTKVLEDVSKQLGDTSALKREVMQDIASLAECEPEWAFRDAPWLQAAAKAQYQHVADRIRLRWVLETGMESLSDHHDLARIARGYLESPDSTLRLFEVLTRERALFLQNAEVRAKIFYPTFANDIGLAAIHFVGQLESLSEIEAEGVLGVLAAFEPTKFLDMLPNLFRTSSLKTRFCWLLLRQCWLTPEIRQSPSRVLRALTQGRTGHSKEHTELIDDAINLWETRKKHESQAPIDEYMRLTAPEIHNLGKAAKKLVVDIRQESVDLAKDWPQVSEALTKFLVVLSRFLRGLPKDSDVEEIKGRIQELGGSLQSAEEIYRTAASDITSLDSATKELLASKFDRIETLIDSTTEPLGIRTLLEAFRTNVLTDPLAKAISSNTPRFKSEGIDVQTEFTMIAPLTFGLAFDLFVAFEIILDNALNSGAKKLLISVEVLPEDQSVHVRFFDNGGGVKPNVTFHHGLQYVQGIASAYGGNFELKACGAINKETILAYNTLAQLTFVHLPELR
jgi:signal transduction histidine kinase/orotate phosphoribosyltransferase